LKSETPIAATSGTKSQISKKAVLLPSLLIERRLAMNKPPQVNRPKIMTGRLALLGSILPRVNMKRVPGNDARRDSFPGALAGRLEGLEIRDIKLNNHGR
jgi:hypothetical protein